jgi:hypothetical protein
MAQPEKKFGHDCAGQADEQGHQKNARVEIQLDPSVRLYGENARGLLRLRIRLHTFACDDKARFGSNRARLPHG